MNKKKLNKYIERLEQEGIIGEAKEIMIRHYITLVS